MDLHSHLFKRGFYSYPFKIWNRKKLSRTNRMNPNNFISSSLWVRFDLHLLQINTNSSKDKFKGELVETPHKKK
jgi:hypothetical protein